MLERNDLLSDYRIGPERIGNTSESIPIVAILRGPASGDSLLRVAAYPAEKLAYCGLWYRDDLFLGGSTIALNAVGSRLHLGGAIELIGRSNLRLVVGICWKRSPAFDGATVESGVAEIIDEKGYTCERLGATSIAMDELSDSKATIISFPTAG